MPRTPKKTPLRALVWRGMVAAGVLGLLGATPGARPAEVEISGTIETKVPAAKYWIFVSELPCDAKSLHLLYKPSPWEGGLKNFGLEIFVPQGSKGYLCAAAVNQKNQLIGIASAAPKPFVFQGKGEISVIDQHLVIKRLKVPRPLPSELR